MWAWVWVAQEQGQADRGCDWVAWLACVAALLQLAPCHVLHRHAQPTRCSPPCAARRTTCSDTSTLTQWGNSAHPREFGAGDASHETLATLRQGYAREGECTPSGVAAAAQEAVQHVLRQAGQGQGPGQRQDQAAAIQPLLGARCPLFARKFLPSAAAAWTQLLRPVVKP